MEENKRVEIVVKNKNKNHSSETVRRVSFPSSGEPVHGAGKAIVPNLRCSTVVGQSGLVDSQVTWQLKMTESDGLQNRIIRYSRPIY